MTLGLCTSMYEPCLFHYIKVFALKASQLRKFIGMKIFISQALFNFLLNTLIEGFNKSFMRPTEGIKTKECIDDTFVSDVVVLRNTFYIKISAVYR